MASQTNAFRQQVRETKRDGSKLITAAIRAKLTLALAMLKSLPFNAW